jgi:hypothetical protein
MSLQRKRETGMRLGLVTIIAASILVIAPVIGALVLSVDETSQASRITVVHKNLASPSLEELGQKAGDPSNAGVPESEPIFVSPRKSQWI